MSDVDRTMMSDRAMMEASAGERLEVLLASYQRLTGAALAADSATLWHSAMAVVAHDTAAPPRFFYANRAALTLFRMDAPGFIGMPSAHSAEPDQRAERAAMLARLEDENIVTGYHGIRIAADGSRFSISDAVIWNLLDEDGTRHGQAAAIGNWQGIAG